MKELINQFMQALKSRATGMTFIRKYGPAPKPGYTNVVFLTMVAVPDEEAALIQSELHCPTWGPSTHSRDAVVLAISTGEGKDVSELSRGCGPGDLLTEPIWRI
jgi:hypothetical protein